jgi:GDP-L-fucose synthase
MKKTLILGASGLLGSALAKKLKDQLILLPPRSELNLMNSSETLDYFSRHKPDFVYMCAATVGGIGANIDGHARFFSENLTMQLNFFDAVKKYPPRKALFVGSSCVYPRDTLQPMLENQLMTGPFEPTNEGYAFAKMAGLYQARYLFEESGLVTICPVISNIYGKNDYYDDSRSHVIAALIKRFEVARVSEAKFVTCWGSGSARREFIYSEDAADILISLMQNFNQVTPINVGVGYDISIKELAESIKKMTGFEGQINWNLSMPDGMPVKCMDVSKLHTLGITARTSLEQGLKLAITDYRERFSKCH